LISSFNFQDPEQLEQFERERCFVSESLMGLEQMLENIAHLQRVGGYSSEIRLFIRANYERQLRKLADHGFENDALHYVVEYMELHKRRD
jgi:hypothetical protein